MRQPLSRSRPAGFTVIELLVVISVIAILAAISVSAALMIARRIDIKKARALGTSFATALETYRSRSNCLPVHNAYDPVTAPDGAYENAEVIEQLNGDKTRAPIFAPPKAQLNATGSFKDPWGNPFRYLPRKAKPTDKVYKFFEVYSCGPNGKWEKGKGDDVPAP